MTRPYLAGMHTQAGHDTTFSCITLRQSTVTSTVEHLYVMDETSLSPRPKTNPSAECFQYRAGSDLRTG